MSTINRAVLAALACGALAAHAATIHVNGTTGNDAWDGLCETWDGLTCGPKLTIAAGIAAAQPGDEVVIADGIYTGAGNKNLDFAGMPITVRSESDDPNTCIIDCQGSGRGFTFFAGETETSVLRGLTIRNAVEAEGGGVLCAYSSPTIANCALTGNLSTANGGALFCLNGSPTIVGCTITGNVADVNGGGLFFGVSGAAVIDCVIKNNSANTGNGGGMYCSASSLTLTRCMFSSNNSWQGGGIACEQHGDATIADCTFVENSAVRGGGGVACIDFSIPTITNCTISYNHGGIGGGLLCYNASPTLSNCTIKGNFAGRGAGVECESDSCPILTDCMILANTADLSGGGIECFAESHAALVRCTIGSNAADSGGGMFCYSSSPILLQCEITGNACEDGGGGVRCTYYSSPLLRSCTITSNSSRISGGALYLGWICNPTLVNCVMSGNIAGGPGAPGRGGAVRCVVGCIPTFVNCTIVTNHSIDDGWESGRGGGIYCGGGGGSSSVAVITNCILWSNIPEQIHVESGDAIVTFTDLQGGWPGAGNIDLDPEFLSPTDVRPGAGSPCIDAGDNAAVPSGTLTDLAGGARFVDDPLTPDTGSGTPPIVDMGAYEYQLDGDCNLNWSIDLDDFNALAGCMLGPDRLLETGCGCGDLDIDADVDLVDFATFQTIYTGP